MFTSWRAASGQNLNVTLLTKVASLHRSRKPVFLSRPFVSAVLMGTVVLGSASAEAARLYRYKNDDNVWVIASSVPNERVKNGYMIVDETGRLIQEVEPQRSPEQAKAYIAELEAQQKRDEAIRRINLLYGSEEDIGYALAKALDSIDKSLANTNVNVRQLRSRRQRLETQAARIERSGSKLSPELISNIANLGDQIDNLEAEISQRNNQKDVERERHARDRTLFREVHGLTNAADATQAVETAEAGDV